MTQRHLFVAPQDPTAEQVCLLTREWAERRQVPVNALLNQSISEEVLPDGIAYRLRNEPFMWERLETFVAEEGECCPFLAFEITETGDEIRLRIIQSEATS